MKTKSKLIAFLILLMLLFSTTFSFSQTEKENYLSVSLGFDVRNATAGSEATKFKASGDFLGKFSMVGNNIEVNIGYEHFEKIYFSKYTIGLGYHFPLYGRIGNTTIKTVLIPSIEPTIINRWGEEWESRSSHLSIGANLGVKWDLNDRLSTEVLFNYLPRVDLHARYPEKHNNIPVVNSIYLMIIYRFHINPNNIN